MSFQAGNPVVWPIPADWGSNVRETLEWLTEVITARNGRSQRRELRRGPRRSFGFDVIADGQLSRVADTLLMDRGSKYWLLPIWHDVQLLEEAVAVDASYIACRTAGFDFVAGGQALLWSAVNQWEVVGIGSVETDQLALSDTTTSAWPAGTRLYPLREARLIEQPDESRWTDSSGTRSVRFRLEEVSDWPAVLPAATYRGLPVLEMRPDASEDVSTTFARTVESVDADTGPITLFDWPGRSFREVAVSWIVHGREGNAALRSLLYGLRGRMQQVWLPTWNSDLVLVAAVTASATTLTVEWAGYTLFGRMQANWRDIRIELWDGAVFYRRITSAVEAGPNEVLGIDAALGAALAPGQVRAISFLVLSAQASDSVALVHVTDADGITTVSTRFQGVRNDL